MTISPRYDGHIAKVLVRGYLKEQHFKPLFR